MSKKILVVDDDIKLAETISRLLVTNGYLPLVAYTAEDGLNLAENISPDLCLLDIMIPVMGGFELCKEIRKKSNVPIVFMTALDDVDSVVQGLQVGGDDYLVKPTAKEILLARIEAHIRRSERAKIAKSSSPENMTTLVFGDSGEFVVDIQAHKVTVDGVDAGLTPREFQLLAVLAQNAGRVITTAELIQTAWGTEFGDATDNIKPYIHYLRKKLEKDSASPKWILTARGVGYRFAGNA